MPQSTDQERAFYANMFNGDIDPGYGLRYLIKRGWHYDGQGYLAAPRNAPAIERRIANFLVGEWDYAWGWMQC